MSYRFATLDDMPAFETMLRAYLMEQEAHGSPVQCTRKTFNFYRDLAHFYLKGTLFGVLVLTEEEGVKGFALAGEDFGQPRLDTTWGKSAVVWLVWVDPTVRKTGAGLGMLTFGRSRLLELGFEVAVMSVRNQNLEGQALTLSFGAAHEESSYIFSLKEEPHGQRQHR